MKCVRCYRDRVRCFKDIVRKGKKRRKFRRKKNTIRLLNQQQSFSLPAKQCAGVFIRILFAKNNGNDETMSFMQVPISNVNVLCSPIVIIIAGGIYDTQRKSVKLKRIEKQKRYQN